MQEEPVHEDSTVQLNVKPQSLVEAAQWAKVDAQFIADEKRNPIDEIWGAVDAEFDEPKKTETTATDETSISMPDSLQNMPLIQALNAMVEKPELRHDFTLYILPVNTGICIHTYIYIYTHNMYVQQFVANPNTIYIHQFFKMYIYIYTSVYIYIHIYTYIYIYTFIHVMYRYI